MCPADCSPRTEQWSEQSLAPREHRTSEAWLSTATIQLHNYCLCFTSVSTHYCLHFTVQSLLSSLQCPVSTVGASLQSILLCGFCILLFLQSITTFPDITHRVHQQSKLTEGSLPVTQCVATLPTDQSATTLVPQNYILHPQGN